MATASTLPFSPLTYDELNERYDAARDLAGYRCMGVGAEANAYDAAIQMRRVQS